MPKPIKPELKGVVENISKGKSPKDPIKEIVKNGYKYLVMGGILIPILDENGKHERFEKIH